MIHFTIPQEIINNLSAQLADNLETVPTEDNAEAYAKYDDDHWVIDCTLRYSVEWEDTTEGDGRPAYIPHTCPQEFEVLHCDYYPDSANYDQSIDYSEQLLSQLKATL